MIMYISYFYGPYGHPYDCFPRGLMYIYFLVSTCASMRCIRSLGSCVIPGGSVN